MLVGDLIYNDDFDVNCNFDIYDCSGDKDWSEANLIHTNINNHEKPLDEILDMKIKYITFDTKRNSIVIEAQ